MLQKLKQLWKTELKSQKKAFEIISLEMTKLNSPVLVVRDNYVMMCISDDNSKAESIIG